MPSIKRLLTILVTLVLSLNSILAQINTDRVLAIGRNALYFEDYVLSIQYFNEVIAVKPYLADPYLYRSIAKVYLDDYLGAAQDATECIERNPFLVTAWQVRGIARQNLKDYDGAISDFEQGLSVQPENKVFLRSLAVTYALKKDYHKADSCFNHFIELFPNEAQAYLNRAQLSMEQGDSLRALNDLDKVISLDKGNAYAFAIRSMILAQNERNAEALDDMDHAIRLDPEQSAFYNNRAMIRYNMNDLRGAMSDYDQALELSPDEVLSLYNRGILRAQIGDRNRAISDFSKVLEHEPDNTFAAYNRALLRDEIGDLQGAVDDYQKVFEQHPNFFPALYARAENLKKLGRTKEADRDFKQAFTVEQRVKRERDQRETRRQQMLAQGIHNPDSILYAENDPSTADEELNDADRIRKEGDNNIRKFNRIMAVSMDDDVSRYQNATRGRIQDQRFTVEMQPMFVLSYYERTDGVRQNIYFEKSLSDFNRAGLLSRRLKVVSQEPMLDEAQVQAHFASIDDYSRIIGLQGGTIISYFGRSLDFFLVQDYQSAIDDLNQVLFRKDNFILAYFNRAVIRFRQLEVNDHSLSVNHTSSIGSSAASVAAPSDDLRSAALQQSSGNTIRLNQNSALSNQEQMRLQAEQMQRQRRVECEMCIRDLDKVIELSPTFVYAYFNRAYISSKLANFDAALDDLDKCISLYPNFAEAYYNRGLIYLRQGRTQQGIQDLSKAGELGLVQAYSVLKRANAEYTTNPLIYATENYHPRFRLPDHTADWPSCSRARYFL